MMFVTILLKAARVITTNAEYMWNSNPISYYIS